MFLLPAQPSSQIHSPGWKVDAIEIKNLQPVKEKLTFAHLRAGAVLASLPRLALLAFWSRPSRPKIWQFVFFCLKILDFADVYLHRHSPGALQVPWLGRQPSAQTGEEQKIPFHPSWKKEQNQHFNIILWATHFNLAFALVRLLTGAMDTTK